MSRYSLSILIITLWWMVLAFGLKAITLDVGELPVDYGTYAAAVDLMRMTGSPYAGADSAQGTWQSLHQSALSVFRPDEAGASNAGIVSGPYLYPPSLALALDQASISALHYLVLLTLATIGLCIGWLRLCGEQSIFWLMGMAGSIDLIAIFLGGNIEILLLALSLAACHLMWRNKVLWAAPLISAVLLVKPQFVLLFLAFGCLWAFTNSSVRPKLLMGLGMLAMVLLVIVLEALRWPEAARADFLSYASDPAELQYFALSPEAQWPMNIWNRAPLQVFLNLGFTFEMAQGISITFYLLILGASVILLRRKRVSFAVAFSLAYALLLVARPITWSMPMLAIFTLTAVWPFLPQSKRLAWASAAFLIGATHWAAFALFAAGKWPGLLTLQLPSFPWETLIVFPATWGLLVFSVRRGPPSATHESREL